MMGASKEAPSSGDARQPVQSGYSEPEEQKLQARIQGKRRDDRIRRMEFNHLRKLRQHDKLAIGALPKVSGFEDSSGYANAMPSSEKRERTVSKINAIEAHLVDHWVQRRVAAADGGTAPAKPSPARSPAKPAEVVANAPPLPAATTEPMELELDLDFTSYLGASPVAVSQPVQSPTPAPVPAQETKRGGPPTSPVFNSSGNNNFSDSRIESVELGRELDNPALQDAAIRFADGDIQGAESVLLAAMQDPAALVERAEQCASAVLDLYRATDQAAAFDLVAIDFAQRFGRSAPEWYSVPALLEMHKSSTAQPHDVQPLTEWLCPRMLDENAVAQLRQTQSHSIECHVNWQELECIDPAAVASLINLFADWASKPLAVSSRRHDVLNALLENATRQGDASIDARWWLCRLEWLRIQGLHELYEAVALDYCVTYEVSPPGWVETDCTFTTAREPEDGPDSVPGPDSVYSTFGDTRSSQTLELSGEVLGDARDAMRKLCERTYPGEDMVISCARLIRMDFSATGSLLNWLVERNPRDGLVEFVNVPRLTATLFVVMGVCKHARVVARTR